MWECSICNEVYSDDTMPNVKEAGLFTCQSCYEDEGW